MDWMAVGKVVLLVGGYLLVARVILPRLGVPT